MNDFAETLVESAMLSRRSHSFSESGLIFIHLYLLNNIGCVKLIVLLEELQFCLEMGDTTFCSSILKAFFRRVHKTTSLLSFNIIM